jgi:hypothetical protein
MDILENQTRTDVFKFKKELQKIIKQSNNVKRDEAKDKTKEDQISMLQKKDIKYSNTFVIEKSAWYPGIKYDKLIKILIDLGLKKSDDPKANHLFGIINSKFYQTDFFILNGFQFIDIFTNKYSLFLNLQLYFPTHYNSTYPKSFLLKPITMWNDIKNINTVYIARPIDSSCGIDIIKVYDQQTLSKTKQLLYNDKYINGISMTEYITNPMLYEGRKMHIRAYMLFSLINKEFKSYLFDTMKLFTAKDKYKNEDWNNENIHDTHFKNSGILSSFDSKIFQKLTPKITNNDKDKIIANIKNCILYISKIAISNIQLYSGCKNAYEVYGIDILIKDDLSVFVMEINGKLTGYDGSEYLYDNYYKWITETVIKPCLFPHLEIEQRSDTTPIYYTKLLNE